MVKDPSHAIFTSPIMGPTFGRGHDIYVASNANRNGISYSNFGVSYLALNGVKNKQTILAGAYYFFLDDVEVFYLSIP